MSSAWLSLRVSAISRSFFFLFLFIYLAWHSVRDVAGSPVPSLVVMGKGEIRKI